MLNKNSNKAIAKTYVKVYARTPDAPEGRFLKDGYTDLRGRFDYVTVSTDKFKFTKALAILVLTDSAGNTLFCFPVRSEVFHSWRVYFRRAFASNFFENMLFFFWCVVFFYQFV